VTSNHAVRAVVISLARRCVSAQAVAVVVDASNLPAPLPALLINAARLCGTSNSATTSAEAWRSFKRVSSPAAAAAAAHSPRFTSNVEDSCMVARGRSESMVDRTRDGIGAACVVCARQRCTALVAKESVRCAADVLLAAPSHRTFQVYGLGLRVQGSGFRL